MTEEKFKQARHLRGVIISLQEAISILDEERSNEFIPKEMFNRHLAEKRLFLESELARFESEFAAL